jgi:hypothetical protein
LLQNIVFVGCRRSGKHVRRTVVGWLGGFNDWLAGWLSGGSRGTCGCGIAVLARVFLLASALFVLLFAAALVLVSTLLVFLVALVLLVFLVLLFLLATARSGFLLVFFGLVVVFLILTFTFILVILFVIILLLFILRHIHIVTITKRNRSVI